MGLSIEGSGNSGYIQGFLDAPSIDQTENTKKPDFTISYTKSEGVNGQWSIHIALENPTIGPEDIPINEVLQGLEGINGINTNVFAVVLTTFQLLGAAREIAMNIANNDRILVDEQSRQHVADAFGKLAMAADEFYAMAAQSNYPDATDFIKMMMRVSQEIREAASNAKQAALEGQYQAMFQQAMEMFENAEKTYQATMKELQAARMEAIVGIVTGIVSAGVAIASGVFAWKSFGRAKEMAALEDGTETLSFMSKSNIDPKLMRYDAIQKFLTVADSLNKIGEKSAALAGADIREQAAALKREADIAMAIKQCYEAIQKGFSANEQTAEEIRDLAKNLRDMVLKFYQDFLSSQTQIVQRANI